MQCKLHHILFHSMYAIKINIAYLCNCSASVKSIGTMTCIKLLKQGGALLRSLLDTEHLQTMKSGILQSEVYDAFQNMYSIQYVYACTVIDTYTNRMFGHCCSQCLLQYMAVLMKFVIDQLIYTFICNFECLLSFSTPPTHTIYSSLTGPTS